MSHDAIQVGSDALRGTVLFVEQNGWTLAVDARAVDNLSLIEETSVSAGRSANKASAFVGLTEGEDPRPAYSLPRLLADPLEPSTLMLLRVRSGSQIERIALWTGRTRQIRAVGRNQRVTLPPGITDPMGIYAGVIQVEADEREGQGEEFALLLNLDRLLSTKELERGKKALRRAKKAA